MRKIAFLFILIIAGAVPVFAGDQAVREDLWVCPVFEAGLYTVSNMAMGGGAALGYGDRVAFGLKVIYWNDIEMVQALELNFLLRYYFLHKRAEALAHSGLFIQFAGGPVIFDRDHNNIALPTDISLISAGLSLGWRWLLGSHFFVEPAIRAGYPYIAGGGLSAGVRF